MNSSDYDFITNICYIINEKEEVLLQKKARGFGKGKWNGPGGKKEKNETIKESVRREIREETGLKIIDPEIKGELDFVFPDGGERFFSYVFVVKKYEGEPQDSAEGKLKWFKFDQIPWDKMWDDDRYWLKRLLLGEYVKMKFYFDKNGKVKNYEDFGLY